MSDVDPDVHAEFDEMITVQLARKDARIRELEAELQRSQSVVAPIQNPTKPQSTPALILPPSMAWRKQESPALPAAITAQETPVPPIETVPESPIKPSSVPDSQIRPSVVPPASPYGWSDPVINQHFGLKRYQKILIVALASLCSVLLLAFAFHSLFDNGFDATRRSAAPLAHAVSPASATETKAPEAAALPTNSSPTSYKDSVPAPERSSVLTTVTPGPIIEPGTVVPNMPSPQVQRLPPSQTSPPIAAKRASNVIKSGKHVRTPVHPESPASEPSFTYTPERLYTPPPSESDRSGYRIDEASTEDRPVVRDHRSAASSRRRRTGEDYRVSEGRPRHPDPGWDEKDEN